MKKLPRSIRNNNPLNIDHSKANKWVGILPITRRNADQLAEKRFEVFESMVYGFRAAALLLQNYQDKHKIRTVRGVINRWAPSQENNTDAYVWAVATKIGVDPDARVDLHSYAILRPLIEAMAIHETGPWKFSPAEIDEGLRRAGVVKSAAVVPVTAETVTATGMGLVGLTQVAEVLPPVLTALQQSESHLTSGSAVKIVLGLTMVVGALVIAVAQYRKRSAGAA